MKLKMTKREMFDMMMNESIQAMSIPATATVEENGFNGKKVQKLLNKLISEEVIARDFYLGCILAIDPQFKKLINAKFTEIAADEINDHCNKLVKWATQNGYDVPFKPADYTKYASKTQVKALTGLKSKQDPLYYIEQAIKAEEDAIKSYTEAQKEKDIPYEFTAILLQNYYDEVEHLETLKTMALAFGAGAVIV